MSMRSYIGVVLVIIALLIVYLQYAANTYYLYWVWWWFDILMHFLGGLLMSGFVLWLVHFEFPVPIRNKIPLFVFTLVAILVIGVSWEVYEYMTKSYNALNYVLDTTTDLATDVVGMLVAYLFFKRYVK